MAVEAGDNTQAVAEAMQAVMAAERARVRAGGLTQEIERERIAYDDLRMRKVHEQLDVERLEARSVSRFLASFGNEYDLKLRQEQAEVDAVLLEMAIHAEAQDRLAAELAEVTVEAAKLPAAQEWLDAELAVREAQLRAEEGDVGRELAEIADREIVLGSRLIEITEAADSADAIAEMLDRAHADLRSATADSIADMFPKGAFSFGDKKTRRKAEALDRAATEIALVHHGLVRLRGELADLDALRAVEVTAPGRKVWKFDAYFDFIAADWMVHRHIAASRKSVAAAVDAVGLLRHELHSRIAMLGTELLALDARRAELLTG